MQKARFPLPVKAVTIDLDGTMLDTVADLALALNLMLEQIGLRALPEAQVRTYIGKGVQVLVRRALAGALEGESDSALYERALPIYMDCYERVNGQHTVIYPGVREGLDAMRDAGHALVCVTNKAARFALPLLAHMQLADYFAFVIAGDTLPKRKPDPLPLTHASQRLGVAPGEMLMIGDSLNDALAARAAGCSVFCVPYGYNEGVEVRNLDVDAIVQTLVEAAGLITPA